MILLQPFRWPRVCSRSRRRWLTPVSVGLVVGFCLMELFNFFASESDMKWYAANYLDNAHDAGNKHVFLEGTIHRVVNSSVASKLYGEVRVLCWIMTNPKNHRTKARHVLRTWGKRCNKLLFMSSVVDKDLDTVALPVQEGRYKLWAKTKEAFKYIYEHHMDDADWFLKADDDTYTIVENLRYMLYPYHPDTPIYFGCKFKPYINQGYMSGGAGYVLSREAVRRFVEEALPNKTICRSDSAGDEDIQLGRCMENVKVIAGDSRDSNGRGRFFPLAPEHQLLPAHLETWYWEYIYYGTYEGMDCCSDYTISFHYITPKNMYLMDYLIYHLRPYGILYTVEALPEKLRVGEVMPPPTAASP